MALHISDQPSLLLAEDERGLRMALIQAFEREGYAVRAFSDGISAWEGYSASRPDLMVLDISMPGMDGIELLKRVRMNDSQVAVIFLTSRDEEVDRILGLELGADDYLGKPFSLRELCTRVKVLLRRISVNDAGGTTTEWGRLKLDSERCKLYVDGKNISATITEFRLMECLMKNPGQVRSREILMNQAYPHDVYVADRTIDGHIKRLRKKIQQAEPGYDPVETVYGMGYALKIEQLKSSATEYNGNKTGTPQPGTSSDIQ